MLVVAIPPGVPISLVRNDSPILSVLDTRDLFISRFSWEDALYLSFANVLLRGTYKAELVDDFVFPMLRNEYVDYKNLVEPFTIGTHQFRVSWDTVSKEPSNSIMEFQLNTKPLLRYRCLAPSSPHTDMIYRYGGYIIMRIQISPIRDYVSLVFLPERGLVSVVTSAMRSDIFIKAAQCYRDTRDEAKLRLLGGLL